MDNKNKENFLDKDNILKDIIEIIENLDEDNYWWYHCPIDWWENIDMKSPEQIKKEIIDDIIRYFKYKI